MSARRVPLVDVNNQPTTRWIADLSESSAAALGSLSIAGLRRLAKANARNAMREASARHYAAANYR